IPTSFPTRRSSDLVHGAAQKPPSKIYPVSRALGEKMEDQNLVYKSPESDLGTQNKVEIPDEILKKIKNGWVAAIISGVMTFGIMLLAINTGALAGLFDIWSLI